MARHNQASKLGSVSYYLEEPIEVNYQIAGYADWLEHSIPAAMKSQIVPVRHGFEKADLKEFRAYLKPIGVHGLDTESGGPNPGTGGLKPDGLNSLSATSRLYLFQYGTKDRVLVMQPELAVFFQDYLESDKYLKINHNMKHDFKFLFVKHGIHLVRQYCTMLAEQSIKAGIDGHKVGLLDVVRSYPPHRLISKGVRTEFSECGGVFTKAMLDYGARDVHILFDPFDSQCAAIKHWGLKEVCQLEFDVIAPTAEMELTGFILDVKVLELTLSYWKKEEKRLEMLVMDLFNAELAKIDRSGRGFIESLFEQQREVFDLQSAAQKIEALERIGLSLENIQRSTLKLIGTDLTLAMAGYSKAVKNTSTYGDNLIAKIQPETGRFHPEFHQLGVGDFGGGDAGGKDKADTIATGRYSSDAQQFPKPEKLYDEVTDPDEIAMVMREFGGQLEALRGKKAA